MKTSKENVLTIRDEEGVLVAMISSENRMQTFHEVSRLDQDGIEALMNKVYLNRKVAS